MHVSFQNKIPFGKICAFVYSFVILCIVFASPALAQDGSNMQSVAGGAMEGDQSADYKAVIEAGLMFIGNFILNIASIFTYLGGYLLEGAIRFLIVDMVSIASKLPINDVWSVIRDFCNLLFVFGFLYLGFQMIFDPHSAEAKRSLSHIIIGALLINFSLFIVKFIIDIGNYVAVTLYNVGTEGISGASIPAAVIQVLGVSAFWGSAGLGAGSTDAAVSATLSGWGMVGYYLMAGIFLIVCGFVFAIAAFMLVTRFVTLVMILMASPLLFAANVFPQAHHFVEELWQKLITSSIFPSIFLFMMYVSLKTLDFLKMGIDGADGNKAAALQGGTGFLPVVIFFCISIFFLIQSLMISRKVAESGHDALTHTFAHMTDGFRGFMLRNTAGRLGRAAHHSYEAFAAKNTAKDAPRARRWLQTVLDTTPIDRTLRHTLHAAETEKFGSHYSLADLDKDNKERDAHRTKHNQEHDVQHAIEHDIAHSSTDTKTAMERAISNASTEHVLQLLEEFSNESAERAALVGNLSSSQFEGLMKAKPSELNDGEKEKIRQIRSNTLKNKYSIAAGNPGTIGKASASDLEALGVPVIKEHAAHLSMKQIDEMKGLTSTEKEVIKKERETQFRSILGPVATPVSARRLLDHIKNDTEISKLPAVILTDPHVTKLLNPNVLSKIIDNDSITQADRGQMRATILNYANVAGATPANNFLTNSPRGQSF